MYPDMAVGGDIVRPSAWVERWEKMHRRALRQAARVIVLGDDMRDRILAKGVSPERVVVVRDGTSFPESMPAAERPRLSRKSAPASRSSPSTPGNLGFYGAWNTLLDAARILSNENTGLVFIGGGANRDALGATAADLPNVRFLPFRPVRAIPHVMMAGDVHIVTVRRGLEGVVVPSKLYSILAAGRPVLAVAASNSDAARIVTRVRMRARGRSRRPGRRGGRDSRAARRSRKACGNGPPGPGNRKQLC